MLCSCSMTTVICLLFVTKKKEEKKANLDDIQATLTVIVILSFL